jgi:hypothetical protein
VVPVPAVVLVMLEVRGRRDGEQPTLPPPHELRERQ